MIKRKRIESCLVGCWLCSGISFFYYTLSNQLSRLL